MMPERPALEEHHVDLREQKGFFEGCMRCSRRGCLANWCEGRQSEVP